MKLELWFTQVPWLAAAVVIILALLLAFWTRGWLRAKARRRLTMIE
jgi:hypothetical protein